MDAACNAVQQRLGLILTPNEEHQLSYAAELDYELWHLGTFLKLPDPDSYGTGDLTWVSHA
jgi:hypothetical protein